MLGGLDYKSIAAAVKRALTAAYLNVASGTGSDGQALLRDSSQVGGISLVDNPSRPNLLINPNWLIDQINEGALYTVNATGVQGPDGWSGDAVGTGVFKLRTIADPDNAALKCLEISCTTADAAIAAADRYEIWTAVEGYDAMALQLGVASAQPFTYQFGLKSNAVTGVFGVYFTNSAGNRFYAGTITVPDTAAHEYSVSLTGDLAGTWLYTNGIGLRMGLVLAAGSNFQGALGAWGAGTVRTSAAQANFMSVNTNIIYLKRGQLIQGALVQAYRPADIEKDFAKAQRQYEKSFSIGTAVATGVAAAAVTVNTGAAAAQTSRWHDPFKVRKRAATTAVIYNPAAGNNQIRNSSTGTDYSASSATSTEIGLQVNGTAPVGSAATDSAQYHWSANARLS